MGVDFAIVGIGRLPYLLITGSDLAIQFVNGLTLLLLRLPKPAVPLRWPYASYHGVIYSMFSGMVLVRHGRTIHAEVFAHDTHVRVVLRGDPVRSKVYPFVGSCGPPASSE